jgi:hypothetical protein
MATHRKAQLSVETMIVYGLVILVALSVIGGLIYFNILDIGAYLPDKCDIGGVADLKCEEVKLSSTSGRLEFGVRNIGPKPIEQLSITASDRNALHFTGTKTGSGVVAASGSTISPSTPLAPGEIAMVSIDVGSGVRSGKVMRGPLMTQYKFKDGAITQEATGEIRIKAS